MAVYLNVYRTSDEDKDVTAKVSAYCGSDWVMKVMSESDLSDALYEAIEKMGVVLIDSENGRGFTAYNYDTSLLWDEAGGNDEEWEWEYDEDDEDDDEQEDEDDDDDTDDEDDEEETEEDVAFGYMFDGYSEYQRGLFVDRNASTIEVDSDRKLEAGCTLWRITSPEMLQKALEFFQAKGFGLSRPLSRAKPASTAGLLSTLNVIGDSGPTLGEHPDNF